MTGGEMAKQERKGFIAVTKTYEVECSEHGIIDSQRTRWRADEIAREHHELAHGKERGWRLGNTYGQSWAEIETARGGRQP